MATKKICDRCGAEINPVDSVTYVDMNKGRFVLGNAARELCCSCAYHLGRWLDGKEHMVGERRDNNADDRCR